MAEGAFPREGDSADPPTPAPVPAPDSQDRTTEGPGMTREPANPDSLTARLEAATNSAIGAPGHSAKSMDEGAAFRGEVDLNP